MATTARWDLTVWRNDDVYDIPLRVRGADLTGAGLQMEVRLAPDTPGAPLISLQTVTNANAEGLRVANVDVVDGVPISDVRIRINKSTRVDLPYSGEVGDSATFAYALLIGGLTRLIGDFKVLAHAFGSDNAPLNRPSGGGSLSQALPELGATLTIAGSEVIELVIDGGGSQDAARRAEEAAAEAEALNARATLAQLSPFQPDATFSGPLTRDQLRAFIIDADLSDVSGLNLANRFSFAEIAKSATSVTLRLYEQDLAGNFVPASPLTPRLIFTASGDGYDASSKDVLVLKSDQGGRVAIVPAAIPNSNTERTGMTWDIAGLNDRVFRKGFGLFARLADKDVLTADPDTGALVGAYAPSGSDIHPNDAIEHTGDALLQFRGVGQWKVVAADIAVDRFDTAIFSAFGTVFKGTVKVVRHASTTTLLNPDAGELIETFTYPAAVYVDDIDPKLAHPAILRAGQVFAVYAYADDGYVAGMRYWDHPRQGEPNPTGRTPLLFNIGGGWNLGGVGAGFAYWQVPLRLYGNIPSRTEFDTLTSAVVQASEAAGPLYGDATLRKLALWRQALRDGQTPSITIAQAFSDSWTQGGTAAPQGRYVTLEARELRKPIAEGGDLSRGGGGNGGPGWVGFGFPSSLNGADNTGKLAAMPGNVDKDEVYLQLFGTGWQGKFGSNEFSPNLSSARSSVFGDAINVVYAGTATITSVDLDYTVGAGTGVIEYRWNGTGAWTPVNLTGTGGAKVALANIPAGAFTLSLRVAAGGNVADLNGVTLRTGMPGVTIHMLGLNGSALYGWAFLDAGAGGAAKRAAHAAALARLGTIDVFSVLNSTNDQTSYTPEQYATAMALAIDGQMRVASPGADILWQIPPENSRTNKPPIALYLAAAKPVAEAKQVALLSLQPSFGAAYPEYSAAGSRRQLFEPESGGVALHVNPAGGATIRAARRRAIAGSN